MLNCDGWYTIHIIMYCHRYYLSHHHYYIRLDRQHALHLASLSIIPYHHSFGTSQHLMSIGTTCIHSVHNITVCNPSPYHISTTNIHVPSLFHYSNWGTYVPHVPQSIQCMSQYLSIFRIICDWLIRLSHLHVMPFIHFAIICH